ncbi:hypothetical protein ASF61_05750 [Duganella sp. Leaf126]|uniref:hypothetical protein n=1 Tax=Duganella sp. Leaf126 TaxID=1736266 RepID=UPI0006F819F9|nr:hypothetical protein [Duganella sp. Leaf126]KQQ40279.1 hypothetical protein ASF61_05750 [Duganella sp. Leaf126]
MMWIRDRLPAALLAALLGGVAQVAGAAPPAPLLSDAPGAAGPAGPGGPGSRSALTVIEGKVQRILITPYGEPNGVRLDTGTVVLLPPHLAARLARTVVVDDRVRALGQPAIGHVLRAQALINLVSGNAVDQPGNDAPAPPAPPPARAPLQQFTVRGVIDAVLYGPRNDANGVILTDGAIVYFRPDLVDAQLAPGQPFAATGIGTRAASGLAIEAISVLSQPTPTPTTTSQP